jgi:hypothetical protein
VHTFEGSRHVLVNIVHKTYNPIQHKLAKSINHLVYIFLEVGEVGANL